MATTAGVMHIVGWVGLVLAIGCGQPGGTTSAGSTGESTGSTVTETGTGTTTGSTGSPTESGGSEGQTESGSTTQPATTSATGSSGSSGGETTGSSSGGETTGSSGGETTSSSGGETSSSSGGKDLCEDFEEPGCIDKGCPEGQKCDTQIDCVPSSCSCDPKTGDVICTADCGGGTCVDAVGCDPVACNLFCEFGFEVDEMGCEICKCKEPPPACGCVTDDDCVKASPGCCSCNMGGTEVAVAKACLDQLEPCPLPPDEVLCPAVYKCTDAQAGCFNGQCVLQ